MIKLGTLVWLDSTEEAHVRFSAEFERCNWVLKLDALKDCIYDLTERYNAELSGMRKEWKDKRAASEFGVAVDQDGTIKQCVKLEDPNPLTKPRKSQQYSIHRGVAEGVLS